MDLIRDGNVKTRKDHVCHGCCKPIPKGSTVRSTTLSDEDGIYTLYTCPKCDEWCATMKCRNCCDWEEAVQGYVRECRENYNGVSKP